MIDRVNFEPWFAICPGFFLGFEPDSERCGPPHGGGHRKTGHPQYKSKVVASYQVPPRVCNLGRQPPSEGFPLGRLNAAAGNDEVPEVYGAEDKMPSERRRSRSRGGTRKAEIDAVTTNRTPRPAASLGCCPYQGRGLAHSILENRSRGLPEQVAENCRWPRIVLRFPRGHLLMYFWSVFSALLR